MRFRFVKLRICALKELGIQMVAAYSPQARGRSERSFGTWQEGRLPQAFEPSLNFEGARNSGLEMRWLFHRRDPPEAVPLAPPASVGVCPPSLPPLP